MGTDFDLVRRLNPLPEYCNRRGIKLRQSGGSLVGKCPLHSEHQGAAFVVFDDARWKCFGKCGKSGDVIDLEQALRGGTLAEAAERLTGSLSGCQHRASSNGDSRQLQIGTLKLEGLERCNEEDLQQISTLRSIPIEGLRPASARKLLFSYRYPHQGRCWLITDDARRNAIARRLDGKSFGDLDREAERVCRRKSTCISGSQANWPIGIAQSNGFPAIALCEGAPDFLAAFWLARAGAVEQLVAPVCMTGASCRIHDDALPLFRGKRVRIFGHADEAGRKAIQRWAKQLLAVQADVDAFDFSGLVKADGSPVKDLNDYFLADHKRSGFPIEITTGAFDFAMERRG
jgi:CHC2 zinc finger